jgi:HEAT repeat protein
MTFLRAIRILAGSFLAAAVLQQAIPAGGQAPGPIPPLPGELLRSDPIAPIDVHIIGGSTQPSDDADDDGDPAGPTTRSTSTTQSAGGIAAGRPELPEIPGMSADMVERLVKEAATNPEMKEMLLRRWPQLAEALGGKPEPASRPQVSTASLAAGEDKRKQAEDLIANLGSSAEKDIPKIEQKLLELGAEAMVPLKLAELSDSFELRQRASAVAARLRWRLVCPPAMLAKHKDLVAVMSGPDAAARASAVEKLTENPDASAVPFLAECLADSQAYIRQKAVDALVGVAQKVRDKDVAARARVVKLLDSAMADDDRNIRLLAVGALTKIDAVNVDRLAEMLSDDSPEVRATIIRAMGFSRQAKALTYIKPLLKSPSWQLRSAALEAISELTDEKKSRESANLAIEMLDDPDSFVRDLAAHVLGKWQVASAGDKILKLTDEGKVSEGAGFEALARIKSAAGRDALLKRHAEAPATDRKLDLLTMLAGFEGDAQVDAVIEAALDQSDMAPVRARVIALAGQRGNWARFFPKFCGFLESPDQAVFSAAVEAVERPYDRTTPLPDDLVKRLMASKLPGRAAAALRDAYRLGTGQLNALLAQSLAGEQEDLAAAAIGMISQMYINDCLGQDLPYRRYDYSSGDKPKVRPKLAGPLLEGLRKAIGRPGGKLMPLLAAAVLYRGGADDSTAVRAMLKAGLAEKDTALRLAAMAGITEKPAPFLGEFDLIAASRAEELEDRAIEIMANARDAKYTDRLIEMASGKNTYDSTLWKALVMSGSDKALDTVLDRFKQEDDAYAGRRLAEELKGAAGPGPVKFIAKLLTGKMDEYDKSSLVRTLLTLPDPSVLPVLRPLLDDKKLLERGDLAGSILARLMEFNDAGALDRVNKLIDSGIASNIGSAVEAIVAARPDDKTLDLALRVVKTGKGVKDGTYDWNLPRVINWLGPEPLRTRFLPIMGEMNGSAQDAMMARLFSEAVQADLPALLKANPKDAFTKMGIASLAAAVTEHQAGVNPATMPAEMLPTALIAAGDLQDAPAVVGEFLNDSRPEVAAAARTGLALYLLGHPRADFSDPMRQAMTAAVTSADSISAYLACEALARFDSPALLRIDPAGVPTTAAALRQAVAFGAKVPPVLQAKVAAALARPGGQTIAQLAVQSACQCWSKTYSPQLQQLVMLLPHVTDLAPLVAASGSAEVLRSFLDSCPTSGLWRELRENPRLAELANQLVADARKGSDGGFARYAVAGLVQEPEKGDLLRLIRGGVDAGGGMYVGSGYGRYTGQGPLLDRALAWAPAKEDPEVTALMSATTSPGVAAAAVAAVKWNSKPARELLVKAVTFTAKRQTSASAFRRETAKSALALCGGAEEVPALIQAAKPLKEEEWEQRQHRQSLMLLIGVLAPAEAIKLNSARQERSYSSDALPVGDWAAALADESPPAATPDQTDGDVDVPRIMSRGGLPQHGFSAALAQLREAIRRPAPTSSPAAAPAPSSQLMLSVLPPWGRAAPLELPADSPAVMTGREIARDILRQRIEAPAGRRQSRQFDSDYPDEYLLRRQAEYYGREGYPQRLRTPDPQSIEGVYLAGPPSKFPVRAYLSAEEIASALKPMLTDTAVGKRRLAMKAAADWLVEPLAGLIEERLSAEGDEGLEAAWALAMIKGPAAAEAVAKAHAAATDFTRRVRLACLLRMLGDPRGLADIDRAIALYHIRQFRLKFIEARMHYLAEYSDEGGRGRFESGSPWRSSGSYDGETQLESDQPVPRKISPRQRLLPWQEAIQLAAGDLLAEEGPAPLPASAPAPASGPTPAPASAPADALGPTTTPASAPADAPANTAALRVAMRRIDLSDLTLDNNGRLVSQSIDCDLPVGKLAVEPDVELTFARLHAAEQDLEPLCYVQFADQSASPVELLAKWQAWWRANKDQGRQSWWRQAVVQAAAELTSPKWFNRMVAARRLMRLTGRPVALPNPFDLPAWKNLRQQWNQWLDTPAANDLRLCLTQSGQAAGAGEAGVSPAAPSGAGEAGVSPAAPSGAGDDPDAAWLDTLVRLAGSGKHPVSGAALLQLAAWPDRRQLARHCLTWQRCPLPELRKWARARLTPPAGPQRVYYDDADARKISAAR